MDKWLTVDAGDVIGLAFPAEDTACAGVAVADSRHDHLSVFDFSLVHSSTTRVTQLSVGLSVTGFLPYRQVPALSPNFVSGSEYTP